MADDSSKKAQTQTQTKKALLGELESIKSLLEEPADDIINFDDEPPPILTTTVEPGIDDHEDIPVLTEAFDSVIADIESDHDSSDIDPDEHTFEEPVFEQWPETEAGDDELGAAVETSAPADGDSATSLFDDLEVEFEQQFSDKTTATDNQAEADEWDINLETIGEVEAKADDSPAPAKTDTVTKKRGVRETQPSLFDEPQPQEKAPLAKDTKESIKAAHTEKENSNAPKTEPVKPATNATSGQVPDTKSSTPQNTTGVKATGAFTPALNQPLKTENPFLPKHIRDRLHTSRSLQDEITSMSAASPAFTNKHVESASGESHPQNADDKEQQLIDELVKIYLPKIEQELRQRLRESLAAQSVNKNKPT